MAIILWTAALYQGELLFLSRRRQRPIRKIVKITVVESKNTELIAELNKDVQELHHNIDSSIFKRYSKQHMKLFFADEIANEGVTFFVGYFDGIAAGYIMINKHTYPDAYFRNSYTVVYIEQISVVSEYQDKGIGKALINKVIERAREEGIGRIELDYWNKNTQAEGFFSSLGFAPFNTKMCLNL